MLFSDVLLEPRGPARRSWTTLLSFAAQAVLIALLVIAPLFSTTALPRLWIADQLLAPPPAPVPAQVATAARHHPAVRSEIFQGHLLAPRRIPDSIAMLTDPAPPPNLLPGGPGVPGGTGSLGTDFTLRSLLEGGPASVVKLPPPPRPLRVSELTPGDIVNRVQPVYPPLARSANVQGTVVIHALIGRDGRVQSLRVLNGHPMLAQAALDAVRQWRFRPYRLNGEAVEVETEVTVNFVLNR